jgi:iron complex transport system substrate-binding protein
MQLVMAGVLGLVLLSLTVRVQTQSAFVDDAKRSVVLPAQVNRVFAAGAPAEVLLYTLAPEKLVGRNRVPEGEAVEFFPPAQRKPVFIRQLPEFDNPAADAELVALKPDLYVDYGTVNPDYVEALEVITKRTRLPGLILNGALSRVPDTYRRLGSALGVEARGNALAASADRLLAKYRGALAARPTPPRIYVACSGDGFQPCLADDSNGEQLAWLGGVNVAGTRAAAPRRPLTIEEVRAANPDVVIVAGGAGTAATLRANPVWQTVPAVAVGRVYQWPALPYSWGMRPPSVNRIPGVMWLAYVAAGRPFDAEFHADVRGFYRDFYHLELSDAQLARVLGADRDRPALGKPACRELLVVGGDGIPHQHGDGHRTDTTRDRRDPARHVFHLLRVDVAHDHFLAVGRRDLIDADVDHRGAGLDHVGLQELRLAYGHEHGIGTARVGRDRSREVMADGHRRALRHQHEGRGLADDLGVAHHHHLESVERQAGRLDQLDRCGRGAGREREIVVDDVADGRRVHPFDVLERMNGGRQRPAVNVLRNRALEDDAKHAWVVVHGGQPGFALVLAQGARPGLVLELQPDLAGGIGLTPHIYLDRAVFPDADGHEAPDAVRGRRRAHLFRHLGEYAVAHRSSVQKPVVFHRGLAALPGHCAIVPWPAVKLRPPFSLRPASTLPAASVCEPPR